MNQSVSSVNQDYLIGTSDFSEIVNSPAFVDKTLFVCKVVDSHFKALLLSAPRRFGKSTNMNMLETFLAINANENGEVVQKELTKSFKLFTDKYENKPLLIATSKDINGNDMIASHLASYPVVSISFKDANGTNYEAVLNGIKSSILASFQKHEYLINNKKISEFKIQRFKKYISDSENLSYENIRLSFKFLSQLLFEHFKKKVYVLIDEYDAPLNSAILTNNKDIAQINILITDILKAVFKDNEYLHKGFITGVTGIVRESSGLNNVFHYMFLDNHQFAEYYGFSENETNALFKKFEIDDQLKQKAKNWYDGYSIKSKNSNQSSIYNNWSIVNFLETRKIKSYWEPSVSAKYIKKISILTVIKDNLELLLNDIPITFDLQQRFHYEDIESLQTLLEHNAYLYFSYLFELGYLSYTSNENEFRLPNNEIKFEIKKNMINITSSNLPSLN